MGRSDISDWREHPLPQLRNFDKNVTEKLRAIYRNFSETDAESIKQIEKTTNHDVKAVEYFLKDKLKALDAGDSVEWIHFGLTSQDINNTAVPLLWKEALEEQYLPLLQNMVLQLRKMAKEWNGIPMLARTHGQPASPQPQ